MQYANMLRKRFQGIELRVEDLLFLESFQIGYLPERAPRQELAALLKATPVVRRYLVSMCPAVASFVDEILREEHSNDKSVEQNIDDLLWEIADLIVYSKYPEIYDARVGFSWEIDDIITPQHLQGKAVIDAGSGPGRLAFLLAPFARTVYAVEPVSGFRRLIRQKKREMNISNVYPVDGFLDSLPFPDHAIDYLMTSQAIGWHPDAELFEIERVLKPGGCAIHLFRGTAADSRELMQIHNRLTSCEWRYTCRRIESTSGIQSRYHKVIEET